MARINIMGVNMGSKDFTVHMVLAEEGEEEGEPVDKIIGEAFIPVLHQTEAADIKAMIVDAATAVMKSHRDAIQKRADIKEYEFPDIP